MTREVHDLSARLDRLERENRRLKRWAGSLGGLALLVGLAGAAAPALCDVVMAERLVLRDATGKQRIVADAYSGTPSVTLYTTEGRTLARLGVDKDGGAALVLYDAQGEPRAQKALPQTRPEGKREGPVSMTR